MYFESDGNVQPSDHQSVDSRTILCLELGCNFKANQLMQLQKHLTSVHGIAINSSSFSFSSMQDFDAWKQEYEETHGFTFNRLATKNKLSVTHYYYYCSLGRIQRLNSGKPKLINQCPTRLVLTCNRNTAQVNVELTDGHYGHPPPVVDTRVASMLSKIEIQSLKSLMRRLSFKKNLVQEHVQQMDISEAKKSLYMDQFQKKIASERYKWAESFVAESSLADWQRLMPEDEPDAIIIHKRKGEKIQDLRHRNFHHNLCMENNHPDSFMLGVMTNKQKDLVLSYGKTIILELVLPPKTVQITDKIMQLFVLVMDQYGRKVQVGYFTLSCITNDTSAFRSFFLAIKAKCGNLRPKLLIINERTCLFRYWREIFDADVPCQLLSPWFVEAEFNLNFEDSMIADSSMQKLTELFVEILKEFNDQAFKEKFDTLIHTLRSTRGAERALDYVTQTLAYSLNQDSSSSACPKWAHHAFPAFKDEIESLIIEFTPEKLNALHGNRYKLGRCVYLMVQRQQRGAFPKSSPGSQTALSNASDATSKNVTCDSTLDVLHRQEKQSKKQILEEKIEKIASELKNAKTDTNMNRIGAEILKITKMFKEPDCFSKVKVAEELSNNLSFVHQNLTGSQSARASHSEQSLSRLTGAVKRKQNFDSELLNVENSTNDPIVLSSHSSSSRPNKRQQISSYSGHSDAINSHLPNSFSFQGHETFFLDVRTVICNVPSSNPGTSSGPIIASVPFEEYERALNSHT